MSIQVLTMIKAIETRINNMDKFTLASISESIDLFGNTVCQSNANILRKKFWAQARMLELI